jgi:hypothetical protein
VILGDAGLLFTSLLSLVWEAAWVVTADGSLAERYILGVCIPTAPTPSSDVRHRTHRGAFLLECRRCYNCSKEHSKLEHDGSTLTTDYYGSSDHERGVPWCYVASETWHVLLPHPPRRRMSSIRAIPVTEREDPEGWRCRV